jgi:hypothetical protein
MWKETSDLPHTVSPNRNLLVPLFERYRTMESVSCLEWTCSFCYGVVVIQLQGVAVLQPRDSSKAIHSLQPQQGLRMLSGAVLGEYCISSFSTDEERWRSLDHQKSTSNLLAQDCPPPRTTYQQESSCHLHL